MTSLGTFPFGQPVLEQESRPAVKHKLLVLGAYPSALHVAWQPPPPFPLIRALAVDNEPDVFWDGRNQEALISQWKNAVGYVSSWGEIKPAGDLNGSSGRWVDENILQSFSATREDTYLTDCLNTYRASKDGAARLEDTYSPFAAKQGLTTVKLLPHPNEDEIVSEALMYHKERLAQQIEFVYPNAIVSLGNAALRVLGHLVTALSGAIPSRLSSNSRLYGQPIKVNIGSGAEIDWWPLAHPASPRAYQEAHKQWKVARK